MEINYLTTEEIIKIHDEIIKETGGHSVILSKGNREFIVSQVEITKTVERKAVILFHGILTKHPFVDGDKRTALEAAKVFLCLNGKTFKATEDELWTNLHDISEGKLKFEEVVIWIKERVV